MNTKKFANTFCYFGVGLGLAATMIAVIKTMLFGLASLSEHQTSEKLKELTAGQWDPTLPLAIGAISALCLLASISASLLVLTKNTK